MFAMLRSPPRRAAPVKRRSLGSVIAALTSVLTLALLAGCATPPPQLPAAEPSLLHDALFATPAQSTDAADLFALSDEMRLYAASELSALSVQRDPRQALIDALYQERQLRLSYDGGPTRNAAQAFAARAGNCLSLVIMTAAFARHLGLLVSYRHVQVDETYTRQGDIFMANSHVNLVLGRPAVRGLHSQRDDTLMTVDFLPQNELLGQRTSPLQERTIVAMYLNNRAAEALAEGHLDEAYGWARQAVLHDPAFLVAANTLGVIYARAGHAAAAEQALRQVLRREPDNTHALSNLVGLLGRAGRAGEAQAMAARLAQLQPVPPLHHFNLGRQAMAEGDPRRALGLFTRELRRQPHQDEVHYWAAQAHWQLGDTEQAVHHLREAMENSSSQTGHARYAAKLDSLRAGTRR